MAPIAVGAGLLRGNRGSLEHPCYTLNGPAHHPVVGAGPRERQQDKRGRKQGDASRGADNRSPARVEEGAAL